MLLAALEGNRRFGAQVPLSEVLKCDRRVDSAAKAMPMTKGGSFFELNSLTAIVTLEYFGSFSFSESQLFSLLSDR